LTGIISVLSLLSALGQILAVGSVRANLIFGFLLAVTGMCVGVKVWPRASSLIRRTTIAGVVLALIVVIIGGYRLDKGGGEPSARPSPPAVLKSVRPMRPPVSTSLNSTGVTGAGSNSSRPAPTASETTYLGDFSPIDTKGTQAQVGDYHLNGGVFERSIKIATHCYPNIADPMEKWADYDLPAGFATFKATMFLYEENAKRIESIPYRIYLDGELKYSASARRGEIDRISIPIDGVSRLRLATAPSSDYYCPTEDTTSSSPTKYLVFGSARLE
jgi:hypothetical protein